MSLLIFQLSRRSPYFSRFFNIFHNKSSTVNFKYIASSCQNRLSNRLVTQSIIRNYCTRNSKATSISNKIQSISRYLPKKRTVKGAKDGTYKDGCWGVVAYAAADEFDLENLYHGLVKQGLYAASELPEDVEDAMRVTAKYKVSEEHREIFVFREGCVVFWNVLEMERLSFLSFLKAYSENPYEENMVKEECEMMEYSYAENGPRLSKGKFFLKQANEMELIKYTFSNGMSLSVKLGIWENTLDQFIVSIEEIAEDLKRGNPIKLSREQVLRKIGELFALRHLLNLSSDFLDTPDFYWERENLEPFFQKICYHLNLSKRTHILNEKLNHCQELMQLLNDHLTDNHHVRLEVMIIALITIEIMFEILHWLK